MAEKAEDTSAALERLRNYPGILAYGRKDSPGAGSGVVVHKATLPDGEFTPMPLFMRYYAAQGRWGLDIPPLGDTLGVDFSALLAILQDVHDTTEHTLEAGIKGLPIYRFSAG